MAEEKELRNEEIIELTDEIKTAPQKDENIIELTDEIIDLVDEVAETDSTAPAKDTEGSTEPQTDMTSAPELSAEPERTDLSEKPAAAFPEGELKIGDDIDDELDFDEGGHDDFVDSLGMDLETNSAMSQLPEEPESIREPAPEQTAPAAATATDAISSDQIEAAIERVIMKILTEKIDSILSAAIEKTLAREIDKIKALLLEDSSGGNV
ncbi:MAG: hypothetical protein AB1427_15140 [Thermodesulfobacteriota bacterium]